MSFIIEFLKYGNNFTPFVSLHRSWTNAILKFRLGHFSCRMHGMKYRNYFINRLSLQDIG